MSVRSTPWHIFALVVGCTSSHTPGECEDVIGWCMDECCVSAGAPTFDDECNAICPAGTSLIDRCAPSPDCCPASSDGGVVYCQGGPCCTDEAAPIMNTFDCSWSCPAGYSFSCIPDPGARCAAPWMVCDAPSDCELAPADGCCFVCGDPTEEDVRAINSTHRDEFYAMCPMPACPPCAPIDDPSLRPICLEGFCRVTDVRMLDLSTCNADSDCALRVTECCECGGDTSRLIAIRIDAGADYAELVCDPGQGCDLCAPVYPDTVEAFCAADGHCDVRPRP